MVYDFRDLHFPFLIIILIISYQISFYLIYHYFKTSNEKLKLNKFLPAFGLLYGFGFTGIVIRAIISYYIHAPLIYSTFIIISHLLIFLGTFLFLLIISQKDFNSMINTTITKYVYIATIIISILIVFNTTFLPYNILILSAILIGIMYMLFFHIRLVQRSTGNVKNRIILLFIGEIVVIIMVIFSAEKNPVLFNTTQQQVIQVISGPIIIFGQLIIFYALYEFPIFLEFNWQENLIKLYIVDKEKMKILFQYDFREYDKSQKSSRQKEFDEYDYIFPRGVIGIQQIFSIITETKNSKIDRIQHGDYLILLNHGVNKLDFITYCILVKKEMESIKYFLIEVKSEFEKLFKDVLYDLEAIEGKEDLIFMNLQNKIEFLYNVK